jgi:hypothetical protein
MKMVKVYIASPYTKGDIAVNVKIQMDTANELMNAGICSYVPLLNHFLHMAHPRPAEDWYAMDKEWLVVCDAVLRLPGESEGADAEMVLAQRSGIPVYYSIQEVVRAYGR